MKKNEQSKMLLTVKEFSEMMGFSSQHILRRLSESPQKYNIRYAIKQGGQWRFPLAQIQEALSKGEQIICRC